MDDYQAQFEEGRRQVREYAVARVPEGADLTVLEWGPPEVDQEYPLYARTRGRVITLLWLRGSEIAD